MMKAWLCESASSHDSNKCPLQPFFEAWFNVQYDGEEDILTLNLCEDIENGGCGTDE